MRPTHWRGYPLDAHWMKAVSHGPKTPRTEPREGTDQTFRILISISLLAISNVCCSAQGMSVTDTLEFVLGCYDFDGSGRLTIDEITLAFKSTVTGLCKLEAAKKGERFKHGM